MIERIRVVNKYKNLGTPATARRVNVARPTPLGNPYKLMKQSDRPRIREQYGVWLRHRMRSANPTRTMMESLLKMLQEGYDLELECSCAPNECHADEIKLVLNEMMEGQHAV